MLDCASPRHRGDALAASNKVPFLEGRLESVVKTCNTFLVQSETITRDLHRVQQEVANQSHKLHEIDGRMQMKEQQDRALLEHLRETTQDQSRTNLIADACRALESRLRMELKNDLHEIEQKQQLLVQQVGDDMRRISSNVEQQLQEFRNARQSDGHPPAWMPLAPETPKKTVDAPATVGKTSQDQNASPESIATSGKLHSALEAMAQEQEQVKRSLFDIKNLIHELELVEMRKEWDEQKVTIQTHAIAQACSYEVAQQNTLQDSVVFNSGDQKNMESVPSKKFESKTSEDKRYSSLEDAESEPSKSPRRITIRASGFSLNLDQASINESTWEVTPFLFTPAFGKGGSSVVLSVLILNVILQFVFCIVALTSLTEDDFNAESLEELQKWRLDAHSLDVVDRITMQTMVERVCALDKSLYLSTNQVLIAESISKYVKVSGLTLGAPAGVLMCMLALMVWFLTIMKELNAMYEYLRAILHLDTGPIKIRNTENGTYELTVLDICRKVWCCVVTFLRLTVAGFLLLVGAQTIIYTNSVSDLLLNALALELILNIDEYLFTCLAPGTAQRFVRELEPLSTPKQAAFHGITLQTVTSPILVFTTMAITFFVGVKPHLQDIQDADRILCSGVQDFAYVVDGRGFPHATTNFQSNVGGYSSASMNRIVKDAIEGASLKSIGSFAANNMMMWSYDVTGLDNVMFGDMSVVNLALQHDCTDLLSQTPCNDPVIFIHNPDATEGKPSTVWRQKCPAGYMNVRSSAECREAAIQMNMWNSSAQEQKARVEYGADEEQISSDAANVVRPCQVLRSENNRTLWSAGGFGDSGEGFCVCKPKTAVLFKQFAEVAHSMPINDCEHLKAIGACVFENPSGSGSHDNSTVTRLLCPDACGCGLRPVSPFRTANCPESCGSEEFILTRGCDEAKVEEISESLQMKYFMEDFESMKNPGLDRFFMEELARKGCAMVPLLAGPYEYPDNDLRCVEGYDIGADLATCLKYRCQNYFNASICPVDIRGGANQTWCNSYIKVGETMAQIGTVCPRSCEWCKEMNLCADVHAGDDLYYPTGGYGLARFFRGYCPKSCLCSPEVPMNRDGCPLSCISTVE